MKVPPFKLDHWLAAHEFATPPIRYNLASSTGPSWTLGELMGLGGGAERDLDDLRLSYAPPQGSKLLRERIGASIVVPKPAYPAVPVLARAWGMRVREYELERENGFVQTAAAVLEAVDPGTRAVFVNTPHNPGIPLIVDEVYHPLYHGASDKAGHPPSASALPNTIVLGDFAKAMSLPGLRVGWLIDRDARRREALLDLRSYFTISGSPLTEALGAHALANAPAILERLRSVARGNLALLTRFMDEHAGQLAWAPPSGGTTCFPWLRDGRDARPLCAALAQAGVLAAPGDCFDLPAHLRVGFGAMPAGYAEALAIFSRVLAGG
jgi:aspartate/methionine/tyrosine aminotransferase